MAAIEWNRICCPIDFSETARAGLRVAADLSRRFGAELVLMYAEEPPKVAEELPPAGPVDAQLQAWRQEAERLGAPRVAVERMRGEPELALVELAAAGNLDLIVIGTHGRIDRERMLTGSVAESVVRSAPCPVLTVRPEWRA